MARKTLEYYMTLPYRVEVYPEEDGSGYTASIPDLPGCMTCADTLDELWAMIEEAKQLWLEVALEDDDYVPEPQPVDVQEYSGRFVTRIPRSLHRQLAQRAQTEGTSLNQLVLTLLSDGMGRWSGRERRRPFSYKRTVQPRALAPATESPAPYSGRDEETRAAQVARDESDRPDQPGQ